MKNPLPLLNDSIHSDARGLCRSMLYLRFSVLLAIGMVLLYLHSQQPLDAGSRQWLVIVIAAVLLWSLYSFYTLGPALQSGSDSALSRRYALREMLVDYAWVFIVVFLSGKTANPFIYYYLVLLAIASAAFSVGTAWRFCVGSIVVYSAMLYLDLNQHFDHLSEGYRTHLLGMWVNFIGAALVTCYFVSNLARALREQQRELADYREANLKNEQLIGIGTVAASTVHALATPLSTLGMLVDERVANASAESASDEQDWRLMSEQIERCKATMKKLVVLSDTQQASATESVAQLIDALSEYFLLHSPASLPSWQFENADTARIVNADALFHHALVNLVNNAMEASQHAARVTVATPSSGLSIEIENRLPATAAAELERWGRAEPSGKQHGLGIGSLLANSTIERLGGVVELVTRQQDDGWLQVRVCVTMPAGFYMDQQGSGH